MEQWKIQTEGQIFSSELNRLLFFRAQTSEALFCSARFDWGQQKGLAYIKKCFLLFHAIEASEFEKDFVKLRNLFW